MGRKSFGFIVCIVSALVIGFSGCVPPESVTYTTAEPDYEDPATIKILDFQDRLATDSLLFYLKHENPAYRYMAAMAFASNQDTTAIPALAECLNDPFELPRYAAAYALGQIGHEKAESLLISAFRQYDSLSVNSKTNAAILEAIGKCGSLQSLKHMATVQSYRPTDTLLLLGQTRAIYRFSLRNILAPEGTSRMVDIVCDPLYPVEVRVIAANYLYRTRELDLSGVTTRFIEAFNKSTDPRIRMCLATALGKTGSNEAIRVMADGLRNDPDYRVRCSIIKGFESFSYAQVEDLVYATLKDDNVHVARLAADYLVKYGNQQDALYYRSLSKGQYHWIVKAALYEAANRHLPGYFAITKANMQNELTGLYQHSGNPYEKGLILKALAREPKNFNAIWDIAKAAEANALRTQALEALQQIALDPDLKRQYPSAALKRHREEFFRVFLEAIQSGDDAWIAIAATTINDPDAGMIPFAKNALTDLETVYQTLELPRQIEAYNALGECIAKLKGQSFQSETPGYNHPIDWEIFHSLPDTLEAEIITSQGNVQLNLYKKLAPGTVVNFVRLIRDGFYNDKVVHRVVPNFVIQDGCPRGDGYGSLDYSIRSELPPVYYKTEGKIGMASAGRHTECTQWFITHSPTPHLDGRYTIFGEVREGMNVIHNLQLGARVERIQIVNEIL